MFGAGNRGSAMVLSVVLEDNDPGGNLDGVAIHPSLKFLRGTGFIEFVVEFPAPAVRNVAEGQQVTEFSGVNGDLGGDLVVFGRDAEDLGAIALNRSRRLVFDPSQVRQILYPILKDFGSDSRFIGEKADPSVIESARLSSFQLP